MEGISVQTSLLVRERLSTRWQYLPHKIFVGTEKTWEQVTSFLATVFLAALGIAIRDFIAARSIHVS
jgi:hypothetical protein